MKSPINSVISGRYILEEQLDSGGMGNIFLAEDKLSKKKVVVKHLHSFKKTKNNILRFKKEANILKGLDHPNIVSLIEYLSWNDEFYIILEYLKGISLQEKLENKKVFGINEVNDMYLQILNALEAAHRKQIVHRDLKPSNIFCIPRKGLYDHIKILDFGISISLEEGPDSRLTRTGEIIGTPIYLSPEHIREKQNISFYSDIYSLGIILYELLAGFPPFSGQNDMDILLGHLYRLPGEIQRPDLKSDPLFKKYVELIKQSLKKNINDRFRTIKEVRDFLELDILPERKNENTIVNDRRSRHKRSYKGPLTFDDKVNKTRKTNLSDLDPTTSFEKRNLSHRKIEVAVFEDEERSVEMSLAPLLYISSYTITEPITDLSDCKEGHIIPDIIILNEGNEKNLKDLKKAKLNDDLAKTPVLVCGHEDDLDFIAMTINSGATDYISFPFSPEDIIRKIDKYTSLRSDSKG